VRASERGEETKLVRLCGEAGEAGEAGEGEMGPRRKAEVSRKTFGWAS
jgi:hypothetical protein